MTGFLPVLVVATLLSTAALPALAGGTGTYSARSTSCTSPKFQTPRYNQLLPYRHFEDRRRYNAAPCVGEMRHEHPYLLKTVIVNRKKVPHYTYDGNGRRYCHKVVLVTYKDLFSNSSRRVWTQEG